MIRQSLIGLLCLAATLHAEQAPLPEPLSLDDALRFSSPQTPVLAYAQAATQAADADVLEAQAIDAVKLTARGDLRWVQPAYKSDDDDHNDSRASLVLQKRLYDGGYAAHRQAAAAAIQATNDMQLAGARQQHQLAIMRAFYDVILADVAFARDNEAMSIAFVATDKARDRHELGLLSDVGLLEAESHYEQSRRQRFASAAQQRLTRSKLAIAMGRPNDLVADLVTPQITLPEKLEDDFEAYWQQTNKNNPELLERRSQLIAAQEKAKAARNAYGPVLNAELGAAAYNRATASTHPVFAGLVLEMPILSGGAKKAGVGKANAALQKAQADLAAAELRIRQQALELWMQRDVILADVQAFKVMGDYRDLYLDRSRALYELEVRTDLGDAMTQTTAVRLQYLTALFGWSMNQARLRALSGAEAAVQPAPGQEETNQ